MMKEVNIKDLKVEYERTGKGIPLLILHGWGGSSKSWEKVQQSLASDFEVIVPDLPGFGESGSLKQPWLVSDYVSFILKFVQELELNHFHLVGHSFGGSLAVKFAAEHPDRVRKMVLLDSAGIKPEPGLKAKILSSLAEVGEAVFSVEPLSKFKENARDYFYLLMKNRDYGKASEIMRETMNNVFDYYTDFDLRSGEFLTDLEKVKVPTLVLWGEEDEIVPIEYGRIMNEKIDNSEFRVISQAGHSPNLNRASETAENIIDFFK